MFFDIDELRETANHYVLSKDAIEFLVHYIETAKQQGDAFEDFYELKTAIHTLGITLEDEALELNDEYLPLREKYRKLIEHFLYYPRFPDIAAMALWVLCILWEFVLDYGREIKEFVRGVAWDALDHVQMRSLSIAGTYLHKCPERELLKMLLDVYLNDDSDEKEMQESAYQGLAYALGKDFRDIFGTKEEPKAFDPSIIEDCMHLLETLPPDKEGNCLKNLEPSPLINPFPDKEYPVIKPSKEEMTSEEVDAFLDAIEINMKVRSRELKRDLEET